MKNILSEIENAFVWEGHAVSSINEASTEDKIFIDVTAWSSCEHDGDLSGIYSNVDSLKDEILTNSKNDKYKVKSARIVNQEKEYTNDGEFNVTIRGKVLIEKE